MDEPGRMGSADSKALDEVAGCDHAQDVGVVHRVRRREGERHLRHLQDYYRFRLKKGFDS